MKILTLASAFVLTTALSIPAVAANKKVNDIERVSTFSATTIVGAVAGGPVGMLVGAIGGAYLAEKSKKNFTEREALALHVDEMQDQAKVQQIRVNELENSLAQKLEFNVMFPTGGDELAPRDLERVSSLATYLINNPHLSVRLNGYADPRGAAEDNLTLSAERTQSVADALEAQGIDSTRIDLNFHGASLTENKVSADDHAFERRVDIDVYDSGNSEVASAR